MILMISAMLYIQNVISGIYVSEIKIYKYCVGLRKPMFTLNNYAYKTIFILIKVCSTKNKAGKVLNLTVFLSNTHVLKN